MTQNGFHDIQLHHPGSKQQLEEVWEKQDHMDQRFDPKAFFMMHGESHLFTLNNSVLSVTATTPGHKRSVVRDMEKRRQYGRKRFQPQGLFHDAW